jgi:hypothetical protein
VCGEEMSADADAAKDWGRRKTKICFEGISP